MTYWGEDSTDGGARPESRDPGAAGHSRDPQNVRLVLRVQHPLGANELGGLSLGDKFDRVSLSRQIMTHKGLWKENIKERKGPEI